MDGNLKTMETSVENTGPSHEGNHEHDYFDDFDEMKTEKENSFVEEFLSPWKGILMSLVGVFLYDFDVGSDIMLAHNYFSNNHTHWGAWTVSFVSFACLVQMARSYCIPLFPIIM